MNEVVQSDPLELCVVSRPRASTLGRRYCVAVAEDDDELRRLIVDDLEKEGYDVMEIRDGGELMTYAHEITKSSSVIPRADLLVTDVRMPHCSGLDAMEFFAMIDWRLPTIVMTAFSSRPLRDQASELGAITVLDKPFVLSDLRDAVFNALVQANPQRSDAHEDLAWGNGFDEIEEGS